MATIENEKDNLLYPLPLNQRILLLQGNGLIVSTFTSNIHTSAVGTFPNTIYITAIKTGELRGSITWNITLNGNIFTEYSISINGDSVTISDAGSNIPPGSELVATASLTYYDTVYSAQQTITHSIDTVQSSLSTSSIVIPTNSDGTGGNYANATSTMTIYIGNVDTSSSWSYSWEVLNGIPTYSGQNTRTISVSNLTSDSCTFRCTATKPGWDTQTKTFTITKNKAAISSIYYFLKPSAPVMRLINGVFDPSTIIFKSYKSTGEVEPVLVNGWFKIYEDDILKFTSSVSTTEIEYTPTVNTVSTIKCELYSTNSFIDQYLIDSELIYTVSDGSDAITVELSNDNFTFTAAADGTVNTSSYIGSGTQIRVFEGAGEIDCAGVNSSTTPTINSKWVVNKVATNITCGTLTNSGTYATVGNHSNITADTASITYTIKGRNKKGDLFEIPVTQSFSKSKQGTPGAPGAPGTGTPGADGPFARKCYSISTATTATANIVTTTGTTNFPATTAWGLNGTTWTAATQTPSSNNERLWISDGIATPGGDTVWQQPYWAALKVGQLSAITADMGTLTAGIIRSPAAVSLVDGSGAYIDMNNGDFRFGDPAGKYIAWQKSSGELLVGGNIITTSNINTNSVTKAYSKIGAVGSDTVSITGIQVPTGTAAIFITYTLGYGVYQTGGSGKDTYVVYVAPYVTSLTYNGVEISNRSMIISPSASNDSVITLTRAGFDATTTAKLTVLVLLR